MAVLHGREVGKGNIGFFIGIRSIDRMGFGVPSDRKGVAQVGRGEAQVNVGLDGEDFDLRHLDCGIVNIRGR